MSIWKSRARLISSLALILTSTGCAAEKTVNPNPEVTPGVAYIRLENERTADYIDKYFIAVCNARDWGQNRLSPPLNPGRTETFQITSGCWDMQALFRSGSVRTVQNQTIAPGATFTHRAL